MHLTDIVALLKQIEEKKQNPLSMDTNDYTSVDEMSSIQLVKELSKLKQIVQQQQRQASLPEGKSNDEQTMSNSQLYKEINKLKEAVQNGKESFSRVASSRRDDKDDDNEHTLTSKKHLLVENNMLKEQNRITQLLIENSNLKASIQNGGKAPSSRDEYEEDYRRQGGKAPSSRDEYEDDYSFVRGQPRQSRYVFFAYDAYIACSSLTILAVTFCCRVWL
jgi:hypothetical protein